MDKSWMAPFRWIIAYRVAVLRSFGALHLWVHISDKGRSHWLRAQRYCERTSHVTARLYDELGPARGFRANPRPTMLRPAIGSEAVTLAYSIDP